ncbi:MAG TPA: HDOD domain-containing protein [Methylothermaceae bacterium]|nr:HDOD domain-containing protein [Methylothermaceae bacterium]
MLSRFLNRGSGTDSPQRTRPAGTLAPRHVTVAELRLLIPLRNFSEEELRAFSLTQQSETYGTGSILFERGETDDSVLYLLSGTVEMRLSDDQGYEVTAGSAKARFPLSHGESHSATAIAKTDVEVLRVSARVMHKNLNAELAEDRLLQPDNWDVPESLRTTPLFQTFCQFFTSEELKLPTLPNIAIRLRKAIEKEDIGVAEAAKIVQLDATIATKLMHIANSPLYLRAQPARNCLEAVNRLGLTATCNLVMSLCLKDLFKSRDKRLQKRMQALWRDSLHVSVLSYILAKENHWPDAEEALLAGLLSDIGIVPFLVFVDDFPKEHYSDDDMEAILSVVRGPAGYYVLKKWGFREEIVQVPPLAELWNYDAGPQLALSDIVMLSKLHHYLETGKMKELPAISSIPACHKLRDGTLLPEYSLKVLHEAKAQIQAAMALLR